MPSNTYNEPIQPPSAARADNQPLLVGSRREKENTFLRDSQDTLIHQTPFCRWLIYAVYRERQEQLSVRDLLAIHMLRSQCLIWEKFYSTISSMNNAVLNDISRNQLLKFIPFSSHCSAWTMNVIFQFFSENTTGAKKKFQSSVTSPWAQPWGGLCGPALSGHWGTLCRILHQQTTESVPYKTYDAILRPISPSDESIHYRFWGRLDFHLISNLVCTVIAKDY